MQSKLFASIRKAEWVPVPVIDLCEDDIEAEPRDDAVVPGHDTAKRRRIDVSTTPAIASGRDLETRKEAVKLVSGKGTVPEPKAANSDCLFRPVSVIPHVPRGTIVGTAIFAEPNTDFLHHLHDRGYAVLQGVLGNSCTNERFLQDFWKAMVAVVPRLDPFRRETWTFPKGFRGIVSTYGLPQADFAWTIRGHPRIRDAFAQIFQTKDLVVSLDAVILEESVAKSKLPPWLHKDQRLGHGGLSIQAVYTHFGSGVHDAGTCVVPGSHKITYDWERTAKYDHLRAPPDCGLQAFKPDIPPDSVVFFNSRLVHASVPGHCNSGLLMKGRPRPARLGVCVAYAPTARRSEGTRRRKEAAYFEGKCSSHWPCDKFSLKPPAKQYQHLKGAVDLPRPQRISERLALL